MYSTLIEPTQLQDIANAAVVVDCRFDLARPDAGAEAYAVGHIPGARYAHLDRDLSGPVTALSGRHPLPDPSVLAARFGSWGIDADTQVVAYDADAGMFASRLWWLLRWLGHDAVAVLNGGFKAWVAADFEVSRDPPTAQEKTFVARPRATMLADPDSVAAHVGSSDWCVLDARASERFRGDIEPLDTVAGHIPGAGNFPFAWNLGADARVLSSNELTKKYRAALGAAAPERTIMMCGSGVTACHNLLAMEVAGLHGAKLYAGSWSEWIRDPSRPVARGE